MAVILICALDPDERLVRLVEALAPRAVVVVDDGSGAAAAATFDAVRALGATVLVHAANRGKGAALRTGVAHVRAAHPGQHIVTADCDGQHRPQDVAAVESALDGSSLVLGERRFTGDVPGRSRFGNAVARGMFAVASGVRVTDAQTGLRGLPSGALGWIGAVPGDRFEHEQRVLLTAARRGVPLRAVPIATVYLDGNASSHFRPLRDSVRVAAPLLAPIARLIAIGLGCFALDALLVVALTAVLGAAGPAAVLARLASGTVHFSAVRRWVFDAAGSVRRQARRYALLAAGTIAVGALALQVAVAAGASLLLAKLAIDAALALLTYLALRFGVFVRTHRAPPNRAAIPVIPPAVAPAIPPAIPIHPTEPTHPRLEQP